MTLIALFVALVFCTPELRSRGASNLELFLHLAEGGLLLLLFTDASRTDLRVLKNIRALPVRLLSAAMVLRGSTTAPRAQDASAL